jgi:hypothetical protein
MTELAVGALKKMAAQLDNNGDVHYQLPVGQQLLALNDVIGKSLTLNFHGAIHCLNCGKKKQTKVTLKGIVLSVCENCLSVIFA